MCKHPFPISQRDYSVQPSVARNELRWVNHQKSLTTLKVLHPPSRSALPGLSTCPPSKPSHKPPHFPKGNCIHRQISGNAGVININGADALSYQDIHRMVVWIWPSSRDQKNNIHILRRDSGNIHDLRCPASCDIIPHIPNRHILPKRSRLEPQLRNLQLAMRLLLVQARHFST